VRAADSQRWIAYAEGSTMHHCFKSKELWLAIFLLFTLVVSPVLSGQQPSTEEAVKLIESKLLNLPFAAYKLHASDNGKGYAICNNSPSSITSLELGCVTKENDEYQIVERRSPRTVLLRPKKCYAWASDRVGVFPGKECTKGKLAIIEVRPLDGRRWKLKL
jgi:hypothetical protein